MIDAIKLQAIIPNFEIWRASLDFALCIGIDPVTKKYEEYGRKGYILRKYRGYSRRYKILVLEKEINGRCTHKLIVEGSLNININSGYNYSIPNYELYKLEINQLCHDLKIDPYTTKIDNIEIGLTVKFPVPVLDYLRKCLLCTAMLKERKDFNSEGYNNDIGFQFVYTDFRLKIYDSALKNKVHNEVNILRVEIHYDRMRQLNKYGIKNLSDLLVPEKVFPLIELLIAGWDKVILNGDINSATINSKADQKVINFFNRRDSISILRTFSDQKRRSRIKRYQQLILKCGDGYHRLVRDLLIEEWVRFKELH